MDFWKILKIIKKKSQTRVLFHILSRQSWPVGFVSSNHISFSEKNDEMTMLGGKKGLCGTIFSKNNCRSLLRLFQAAAWYERVIWTCLISFSEKSRRNIHLRGKKNFLKKWKNIRNRFWSYLPPIAAHHQLHPTIPSEFATCPIGSNQPGRIEGSGYEIIHGIEIVWKYF